MRGSTPYIIAGLAAVLIVQYATGGPRLIAGWPAASLHEVERGGKGDRLRHAQATRGARPTITEVEVVGLRDTVIIYRDRDGRVLFRTDPLTNATLVSKDVVLPEITIRDRERARPAPVEVPAPAAEEARLPPGCDPAFSPLTLPSMAHRASRCVAAKQGATRFAALAQ